MPPELDVGQRWRERQTNLEIEILKATSHGTGPAWRYVDKPESRCYCCIEDFYLWDRFEFLG